MKIGNSSDAQRAASKRTKWQSIRQVFGNLPARSSDAIEVVGNALGEGLRKKSVERTFWARRKRDVWTLRRRRKSRRRKLTGARASAATALVRWSP